MPNLTIHTLNILQHTAEGIVHHLTQVYAEMDHLLHTSTELERRLTSLYKDIHRLQWSRIKPERSRSLYVHSDGTWLLLDGISVKVDEVEDVGLQYDYTSDKGDTYDILENTLTNAMIDYETETYTW